VPGETDRNLIRGATEEGGNIQHRTFLWVGARISSQRLLVGLERGKEKVTDIKSKNTHGV